MPKPLWHSGPGPFRADQLRPGDPYELADGHTVDCAPTGGRGGRATVAGVEVIDTDPAVEESGVDVGFSPTEKQLRAPDVAVGPIGNEPGWVKGRVPTLAVEYADTGQDEPALAEKIADLLAAGTRVVWVVRLEGPRRVEVHEPGKPLRTVGGDADLAAPGILRNVVPVAALYDRETAHDLVLRNLLQRRGYESLDAVRDEGREEGREEGRFHQARASIRALLAARGVTVSENLERALVACRDVAVLEQWLVRAASAGTADAVTHD